VRVWRESLRRERHGDQELRGVKEVDQESRELLRDSGNAESAGLPKPEPASLTLRTPRPGVVEC